MNVSKGFQNVLAFVLLTVPLSGCFDSVGTRFTEKPTAVASDAEFTDSDQTEAIGGTLTVYHPTDEVSTDGSWTFDHYNVRWAQDGVPLNRMGFNQSGFVTWVPRLEEATNIELYGAPPPDEANGLAIIASNALGEADDFLVIPFENLYVNPLVPKVLPSEITFSDFSPQVNIQGYVTFNGVTDPEFPINRYHVRYADENGCPLKMRPIALTGLQRSNYYRVGINYYPPADARSIIVISANQYGEAYSADCNYPSSDTETFNSITPSVRPYFQSAKIEIGPDQDDTNTYSGVIKIHPSQDERDLSTGYYVDVILKDGSDTIAEPDAYFPANGSVHEFNAERIDPRFSKIMITTGQRYYNAEATHEHEIDVQNHEVTGDWYTIRNKDKDTCIRAEDNTALTLVACDRYDNNQRFRVTNVESPDDTDPNSTNKDHYYTIESVAFPGRYMHRPYTAPGTPELWGTGSGDWKSRFLLKAFQAGEISEAAVNKDWKKMAIVNKVGAVYHFACANVLAVNSTGIDMPWSNCSGIPTTSLGLITSHMVWRFENASGQIAHFKDTP